MYFSSSLCFSDIAIDCVQGLGDDSYNLKPDSTSPDAVGIKYNCPVSHRIEMELAPVGVDGGSRAWTCMGGTSMGAPMASYLGSYRFIFPRRLDLGSRAAWLKPCCLASGQMSIGYTVRGVRFSPKDFTCYRINRIPGDFSYPV